VGRSRGRLLNLEPIRSDHVAVAKRHAVPIRGPLARGVQQAVAAMFGRRDRRRIWLDGGDQHGKLIRLAVVGPLVLVAVAVLGLTLYCRHLLQAAAVGTVDASAALYVAAGGFLLATSAAIVLQSARVAQRVAGPEHRLRQVLQRIRAGDLTTRARLRKGDLLGGLAEECNELIDWLNHNPPSGTSTGSDLLLVDQVQLEEPVLAGEERGS